MIIDSQVHAYEANTPKRPWHSVPNWPPHVTGDEMVAAMDKVGVDGAIFISAFSLYQYDASYAVEVQRKHPGRFAIIKPVDPFKEFTFDGSDLKVWTIDSNVERQKDANAKPYKSLELIQVVSPGEGLFQSALHTLGDDEKDCADLPTVSKNYSESFAKAIGGKLKMINQGWQSDAIGPNYWMVYEITANGNTFKCTMVAVASGKSLLLQTGMLISQTSEVRGVGHIIMNSYRLSQP